MESSKTKQKQTNKQNKTRQKKNPTKPNHQTNQHQTNQKPNKLIVKGYLLLNKRILKTGNATETYLS